MAGVQISVRFLKNDRNLVSTWNFPEAFNCQEHLKETFQWDFVIYPHAPNPG